ncbi:class I SAM-dependent methyltransferase [Sinorhizobium sp. 22678]|uniref:class I SAM-dependent methyltransferase n=1 Tax=Sinorhizobium sp. 22678 TaxID=3453955 RepID=UPI003F85BBA7
MPDPYSQTTTVDPSLLGVLIKAMELRAADSRSRTIREKFFASVDFPEAARVLEIGCGSGAISRELAHCPNVGEIVGLDPSPVILAKARELAAGIPKLRFHPQRVSPARTLISVPRRCERNRRNARARRVSTAMSASHWITTNSCPTATVKGFVGLPAPETPSRKRTGSFWCEI